MDHRQSSGRSSCLAAAAGATKCSLGRSRPRSAASCATIQAALSGKPMRTASLWSAAATSFGNCSATAAARIHRLDRTDIAVDHRGSARSGSAHPPNRGRTRGRKGARLARKRRGCIHRAVSIGARGWGTAAVALPSVRHRRPTHGQTRRDSDRRTLQAVSGMFAYAEAPPSAILRLKMKHRLQPHSCGERPARGVESGSAGDVLWWH